MGIIVGNGHGKSIRDKAVCSLRSTNNFGKNTNPSVLQPAMGKWLSKPVKLCLKLDLVSYLALVRWVG